MANLWPMRVKSLSVFATLSLLVLLGGCETLSDFFRQRPQALPPASELYAEGETQLNKSRFEEARTAFRKVAERHPQSSYAPRARFLIGEAYYREGQFDKAIKEFEAFMSFYSGNTYERFMIWNRLHGPYEHAYWALLFCNLVAPQVLWFRKVRASVPWLFVVAMIVNVGMWLERYVIVVVSLSRDFLPSSWGLYSATRWDWATFIGSIGLFLALMFLFIRLLPMISIFEMRAILPEAKVEAREDE